jgi:hypothetical protein
VADALIVVIDDWAAASSAMGTILGLGHGDHAVTIDAESLRNYSMTTLTVW